MAFRFSCERTTQPDPVWIIASVSDLCIDYEFLDLFFLILKSHKKGILLLHILKKIHLNSYIVKEKIQQTFKPKVKKQINFHLE